MFGLTPYNKSSLQRRNNRDFPDIFDVFDDFFNHSSSYPSYKDSSFKIDVKDNEKEYLIEAEVPGVAKDQICLDYDDGRLTIVVNKNEEIEEEKENYLHRERRSSSMRRGIYLNDINEDAIKAELKDGVLSIKAPKLGKPNKGRRIDIQ